MLRVECVLLGVHVESKSRDSLTSVPALVGAVARSVTHDAAVAGRPAVRCQGVRRSTTTVAVFVQLGCELFRLRRDFVEVV